MLRWRDAEGREMLMLRICYNHTECNLLFECTFFSRKKTRMRKNSCLKMDIDTRGRKFSIISGQSWGSETRVTGDRNRERHTMVRKRQTSLMHYASPYIVRFTQSTQSVWVSLHNRWIAISSTPTSHNKHNTTQQQDSITSIIKFTQNIYCIKK